MYKLEDVIKLGPEAIADTRAILARLNEIDRPAVEKLAKTISERESYIALLDSALEFKDQLNGDAILDTVADNEKDLQNLNGALNFTPPPDYDAKNMSTHEKALSAIEQNGGRLKTKDIKAVVVKFDGKYKDPKLKNITTILNQNKGKTVRKVVIDGKPGYERIK